MVIHANRVGLGVAGVASLALSFGAVADTTTIPNLFFTVSSGGTGGSSSAVRDYLAADIGNSWSSGNSTFGFVGSTSSVTDAPSDFHFAWNLLVNPDPFIVGNIIVTNVSSVTQTLFLQILLPTNVSIPETFVGGSVSGTLTDLNGNGATLSTVGSNGLYTAITDFGFGTQSTAGTLLNPATVTAGVFQSANIGPASFGSPIPSQLHGAVNENLAVQFQFSLSAGDSASFTSIFVVEAVPVPGAISLLALAGFQVRGGRRRR